MDDPTPPEPMVTNSVPQQDEPEFEAEGWWKKGVSIYQNVHGKLIFNGDGVTMIDEAGQPAFSLSYQDIKKVSVNPGSLKFKTPHQNYYVSFFDIVKTGLQVSGIAGGVISRQRGVDKILSYAPVVKQAEMVLRNHNINLTETITADRYRKQQLMSSWAFIVVGIGIIIILSFLFFNSQ